MKLIKKLALFVLLLFINLTIVKAEVTIDQVVESLNTGSLAQEHSQKGGTLTAKYDEDSLDIIIKYTYSMESFTFKLDGNIITYEYDPNSLFYNSNLEMFGEIVSEIGILHGYNRYELNNTIISEKTYKYTLKKEGFEKTASGEKIIFKIDTTKKVPVIDLSDVYIEEKDLEDLVQFIESGRKFGYSKIIGNIYIWVKVDDNLNMEIMIGEKNQLSENAYKSLISVISKVYKNEKMTSYFKENIKSLNKTQKISGFEIYTDMEVIRPYLASEEEFEEQGYKLALIKTNKEEAISSSSSMPDIKEEKEDQKEEKKEEQKTEEKQEENENAEEKDEQEQQEENTPVYPKTMDLKILIIPAVAVALISIIIIVAYLKNEKKKEQLITNPIVEQPVQQPIQHAQQPVEQLTPAQPVVQEEFSQPVAPVAPVAPVQNFEQPPNNNNL